MTELAITQATLSRAGIPRCMAEVQEAPFSFGGLEEDEADNAAPPAMPAPQTPPAEARRERRRRPNAGRPPLDPKCIAAGCPKSKIRSSVCCAGHKPDYQNLYNDAKAKGGLAEFKKYINSDKGKAQIQESHAARTSEAAKRS